MIDCQMANAKVKMSAIYIYINSHLNELLIDLVTFRKRKAALV